MPGQKVEVAGRGLGTAQFGLRFFLFFFPLQKSFLFPFGPRLGEGSRVVNKLPSGCRERLQGGALTPEGLLTARWAPGAPSGA